MLFNIEDDRGDLLVCYIVPDGFSTIPRVRLVEAGETILVREANETREALVGAGRHETGRCGFRLDDAVVPGLRGRKALEIYDDDSGVLIYRRPRPKMLQKRLLRLETHLFPLWKLDDALNHRFQYFMRAIESFGRETATQTFLLNSINSVYISGRLYYKSFANYIEDKFDVYIVIQDPYEEIAERLLILGKIRALGAHHLGSREAMMLEPAMKFAESLVLTDEKALKRAFRKLPAEVTTALSNPLTRQLTAAMPDEMPSGGAVAASLDLLATFKLIGLRSDPMRLRHALGEFAGVNPDSLPILPQFQAVPTLARMLRRTRAVEQLIEKDLEVYHCMDEAMRRVAEKSA